MTEHYINKKPKQLFNNKPEDPELVKFKHETRRFFSAYQNIIMRMYSNCLLHAYYAGCIPLEDLPLCVYGLVDRSVELDNTERLARKEIEDLKESCLEEIGTGKNHGLSLILEIDHSGFSWGLDIDWKQLKHSVGSYNAKNNGGLKSDLKTPTDAIYSKYSEEFINQVLDLMVELADKKSAEKRKTTLILKPKR